MKIEDNLFQETRIGETCQDHPCQNNGTCLFINEFFLVCLCTDHFMGFYCDIDSRLPSIEDKPVKTTTYMIEMTTELNDVENNTMANDTIPYILNNSIQSTTPLMAITTLLSNN